MDKAAADVANKRGGATGVGPWGSTYALSFFAIFLC
jgi:hypothetical protein